ncbi:MAG: hypothetical protein IJ654_07710 [Bacteroidales bacterium]|nr:hypothetical protein [Bacteroidales bacterium]
MRFKTSWIATICLLTAVFSSCGINDIPVEQRENWRFAARYAQSHREAWHEIWSGFDIPADVAESIVFPELVRYNRVQDSFETTVLESAYPEFGIDGCDYSIGRFQMKPSFIEDLEKRWMRSGLAQQYGLTFDMADTQEARQARLDRLKSEEGRCTYLALYLRMLYLDYGSMDKDGKPRQQGLETLPRQEQAYLAATAYNHGTLWRSPGAGSLERIRSIAAVETFPLPDNLLRTRLRYYSYGDLAARYYGQTF